MARRPAPLQPGQIFSGRKYPTNKQTKNLLPIILQTNSRITNMPLSLYRLTMLLVMFALVNTFLFAAFNLNCFKSHPHSEKSNRGDNEKVYKWKVIIMIMNKYDHVESRQLVR
jgi:hypothetical protein